MKNTKKLLAWAAAFCMVFSIAVFQAPLKASAAFPFFWFEEEEPLIEVPVLVLNGTGADVYELYLCGSGDGDWGGDRLGPEVLHPGEYVETILAIRDLDLLWDLKTVDLPGNETTWYSVDIGRMPSSGFIIELLSDGSSSYLNLAADLDELLGYYGPWL